jgi:pyrroline-5-carboxylate reductase
MTRFGFYGPGNMGEYLMSTMISGNHSEPVEFCFYHPRKERCLELMKAYSVNSVPLEEIGRVNALFICVKPNQIEMVCQSLKPILSPDCVVLSIAAGVPRKYLQEALGTIKVARCMMSIVSGSHLNIPYRMFVWGNPEHTRPLSEYFRIVEMKFERDIDRAMATLSCGPAFFSEIFSMYTRSAMLFLQDYAGDVDEWVREMFLDTLQTMQMKKPDDITAKVACKDGATEKALTKLRGGRFQDDLYKAFESAYNRAQDIHDDCLLKKT